MNTNPEEFKSVFSEETIARLRETAELIWNDPTIKVTDLVKEQREEEELATKRAIAKKEVIRGSVTMALCFGNLLASFVIGYTLFQALHTPKPSPVPPVVINR
ncbi:hypothetical protein [Anabaena catenula]|uniref:Uncharacterized protein n=1 Tax=Anabaena catenula FACHB-362 TaxID=2692877 RepID=A0ABR8J8B8_9NOST|nr:hypothetical protein [Anabaena catenula]MBD2694450.1 hypothetical protein [Anabaena catenula FACHB-362]